VTTESLAARDFSSKAEAGGTIRDPFTCRADFVDGNLADTLALFDHAH
jgi:hypothetical protein